MSAHGQYCFDSPAVEFDELPDAECGADKMGEGKEKGDDCGGHFFVVCGKCLENDVKKYVQGGDGGDYQTADAFFTGRADGLAA